MGKRKQKRQQQQPVLCGKDAAVVLRCKGNVEMVTPTWDLEGRRIDYDSNEHKPVVGEPFHLACAVAWMLGKPELRTRLLEEYEREVSALLVASGGATVQ